MSDASAATAFSTPRDSSDQMALRAKKKAKSRANSGDEVFDYFHFNFIQLYSCRPQDESYARPTALGSYDNPLSRRNHQSSPFTALSSVAMDELYLLEQEEAFRRAEYEARRAEALRRAESQSRLSQVAPSAFEPHPRYRLSKSATTSPIMRNALALASTPVNERSSVFPLSTDPSSHPSPSTRPSSKRRLSGPAWPTPQQPQQKDPPLTQSRSSGHLVDSMRASTSNHHHGKWTHPYHPHQYHHLEAERARADRSHAQQQEDSPSPISSDSELLGHDGLHKAPKIFHLHGSSTHMPLDNSPPHSSSVIRPTTSDFAFTPSASPFLGPMRTLNIHSTTPSRAPSPIFLPPSSVGHGDEGLVSHSRAGSMAYGSPPLALNSFAHRKQQHWRDGYPGSSPHGSSQLPTPQLSSGPSSNGSSSGSYFHGLPHLQHQLGGTTGGSGTPSAPDSRAPSPIHWGHRPSPPSSASTTSSFHHISNNNNGHTHHLAHSVRAAFGMTPIHSHPPSRRSSPPLPPPSMPRNTSWSASSGSGSWQGLPLNQHSHHHHPLNPIYNNRDADPSLPGSRSSSPPIRLPPLKMLPSTNASTATTSNPKENTTGNSSDSGTGDQQQMVCVKKEKVELPGFSEFEAALSSSAPTADARMSIDFVR